MLLLMIIYAKKLLTVVFFLRTIFRIMEKYSSFDRLVSGLSSSERTAMLEKIQSVVTPESQSLVSDEMQDTSAMKDIEIQMKSESIFVRIWIFLKSILTNTDKKILYNAYLLSNRGKIVEKKHPHLIDSYRRIFLQGFYDRIEQLEKCADFFKESISSYEQDPGEFYVFLSSLIVPEVTKQISEEVNPSNLPFTREVTNELRVSLVRKMDNIIQGMPSVKRAALYNAVCNIEWLRQFSHLPFSRVLASFTDESNQKICPFDSIKTELCQFAKILCHGRTIVSEVLEGLYVFTDKDNSVQESDYAEHVTKYIENATSQISMIKMFIDTVPLRTICSVVNSESSWSPEYPEGCEDWFVKFKATWKKAFDKQWEQWLSDRKKDTVVHTMQQVFGFETMPVLPNRPWRFVFGGIKFAYEFTLSFLNEFYQKIYPNYQKIIKILMVEGVFYIKDNLVELTDSFTELENQKGNIIKLIESLGDEGTNGILFEKLKNENIHSPRGKAKVDSLIKSIESESHVIIVQWGAAARSIQMIIQGVISGTRNNRYDTISNLSAIQGKDNVNFREKLLEIKNGLAYALEIVKELESIK